MPFLLKILGKKCLVMHSQEKAEDSYVRVLIQKCQFETVALKKTKREQGLNTPAAPLTGLPPNSISLAE